MQTDKQIIKEIICITRNHYALTYTGYDTHITRKNLSNHVLSMCKESSDMAAQIKAITAIANNDQ